MANLRPSRATQSLSCGKGMGVEESVEVSSWALWGTMLCSSGLFLHALKYLLPVAE